MLLHYHIGSGSGSATSWSQTPEDGHINVRNMLNFEEEK